MGASAGCMYRDVYTSSVLRGCQFRVQHGVTDLHQTDDNVLRSLNLGMYIYMACYYNSEEYVGSLVSQDMYSNILEANSPARASRKATGP